MLKIRLSRTGKNSQPSFRAVVQEHTAPVKGKPIEALGYYRPAHTPKEFKINLDRIKHWMSVGAQPSDAMAVLLKQEGVDGMEKFIAPRDKKSKKKKAVEEKAEAAPAAVTPAPAPVAAAEETAAPVETTPKPAAEAEVVAAAEEPAVVAEAEAPAEPAAETPAEEATA